MLNISENVVHAINEHVFGAADYTVFTVMLGISTAIGIYFGCFGQNSQSTEEYLLGGRKMKTIPIAISLIASQLSGISIMSIPAEMYSFGSQYFVLVPMMIIVVILLNYVIIPVFYSNNIANCYEYLEMRFNKKTRTFITFLFVVNILLILPVIMFIPSLAFSQVTGVNIHFINILVSAVCVFYTMIGGIKAVVWTDVIQAGIMVSSCILVVVLGVSKVGGLSEVWRRAEEGNRIGFFNMDTDLTARQTFWNITIGTVFMWTGYVGFSQSCVQRIVALPTIHHARRSLTLFAIGFIVIMSLNCFTGIVMFARYFDCDPIQAKLVERADKMMPYFVQDVTSDYKGMPGVFISCVFSAGLSTMSASLNSLSGIIYEDWVRPFNFFKHSDRASNLSMKTIVVVLGLYCVAMGLVVDQFQNILQMVMTIAGVTSGATMGVFFLGLLWPWANNKGAIWGGYASLAVMTWIIGGSQVLIRAGEIFYTPLPTTIENCTLYGFDVSHITVTNVTTIMDHSFSIYKISFPWFTVIGTIIVFIVGIPVSHFTGGQDFKQLGKRLFSPVVFFLLPEDVRNSKDLPLEQTEKMLPEVESDKTNWEYDVKLTNIDITEKK